MNSRARRAVLVFAGLLIAATASVLAARWWGTKPRELRSQPLGAAPAVHPHAAQVVATSCCTTVDWCRAIVSNGWQGAEDPACALSVERDLDPELVWLWAQAEGVRTASAVGAARVLLAGLGRSVSPSRFAALQGRAHWWLKLAIDASDGQGVGATTKEQVDRLAEYPAPVLVRSLASTRANVVDNRSLFERLARHEWSEELRELGAKRLGRPPTPLARMVEFGGPAAMEVRDGDTWFKFPVRPVWRAGESPQVSAALPMLRLPIETGLEAGECASRGAGPLRASDNRASRYHRQYRLDAACAQAGERWVGTDRDQYSFFGPVACVAMVQGQLWVLSDAGEGVSVDRDGTIRDTILANSVESCLVRGDVLFVLSSDRVAGRVVQIGLRVEGGRISSADVRGAP